MRRIFYTTIIAMCVLTFWGCKKALNVEPLDGLSGNNFWKSKNDVESFTREVYRLFRQSVGVDHPIMLMPELRNAPVVETGVYPYRRDVGMLSRGEVKTVVTTPRPEAGTNENTWWQNYAEWDEVSDWNSEYKVIQSANILYEQVDVAAENDPSFSENDIKRYKGEAVFMRCMTYFILLRLFGDVPYYTDAYHDTPLPRTNHLEVAKSCLADLNAVKDDLPWTYNDPANKGVRAMRGSALGLMMHLNMWLAGFDKANASQYYQQVDILGDELYNEGVIAEAAYQLIPIERSSEIFIGRSNESLFEIPNNVNYGDSYSTRLKAYFGHVLHYPYFNISATTADQSELAYTPNFMKKIYPEDELDGRIDAWFTDPRPSVGVTMYSGDGKFLYFKYFNLALGTDNDASSVGNSLVIMRLADALLLQAEAAAELGDDQKATELLNMIRNRAHAGLYPSANNYDNNLKDAIYWERVKELLGEGHYFYDLVRTGRILNSDYCWHPMSYSAYSQQAWTWPINANAFNNNPYMTYNNYWR